MANARVLEDSSCLGQGLGAGGLATVWAAHHVRTGTRAAVKLLRPDHAADPAVRARFGREGYAGNQVSHPAVVRVLGDGVDGDAAFLVLERVEGTSLKASWTSP